MFHLPEKSQAAQAPSPADQQTYSDKDGRCPGMIRLKEVVKDEGGRELGEVLVILYPEFSTERRMYCCRF
jgi:hypothetical protein